MEGADFNMYFYFEGERSQGTQFAQTASKMAPAEEEEGNSINMSDADFNMYFYF